MAVDSPSGSVRRPTKFGAVSSSDDNAKASTKAKAMQHGGASSSSFAKAFLLAAAAAMLCCAAVKVSSNLSPHPGHAQLKALITDGKWRHAEIDHLYKLGESMEEAIGLVSFFSLPSSSSVYSFSTFSLAH